MSQPVPSPDTMGQHMQLPPANMMTSLELLPNALTGTQVSKVFCVIHLLLNFLLLQGVPRVWSQPWSPETSVGEYSPDNYSRKSYAEASARASAGTLLVIGTTLPNAIQEYNNQIAQCTVASDYTKCMSNRRAFSV